MHSKENKNTNEQRTSRNIDGIFIVPKIKKIKEVIEENKLVPTYSNILDLIETRKPNRAQKILIAICAIMIFAIMPIKFLNSGNATKAYAQNSITKMELLYQSLQENDFEKTKKNILSLQNDIEHIQKQLSNMGQRNIFISKFFPFKNTNTNTENILDIASSTLKIGTTLADDLLYFQNTKIETINNNKKNEEFFARIKDLHEKLKELESEINSLDVAIQSIDQERLNKKEKKYLEYLKNNSKDIEKYYQVSLELTAILPSVLGENFDKKYLVLFQNNTELRATGGFIGSYGIVTIRDAKIKDIFVESIYNPDGQIGKIIEPPDPLKKITKSLAMRDANWNPNFPESAKLITDLYEKEGGFTPDGIIAIDTKPFIDFLNITGPINLDAYEVEINSDNFIKTTQYKTSIDYDLETNNPKEFLNDLAPLLIEKILGLEKENQNKILGIILKNVAEKHIQFYSFDESLQQVFSKLNASGETKSSNGDYFYYVNSNIGGLKTNDKISESITHKIDTDKDGYIVHEAVILRQHNGNYEWPSGVNYAYMRFYIPEGSQVLEIENFEKGEAIKKDATSGMMHLEEKADLYPGRAEVSDLDISSENGKMVIGAWQVIKPGEIVISRVKYKIPIKMDDSRYSLLIQKQSGTISQKTLIQINKKGRTIERDFNLFEDQDISIELPE